jgi:hypothetical protein
MDDKIIGTEHTYDNLVEETATQILDGMNFQDLYFFAQDLLLDAYEKPGNLLHAITSFDLGDDKERPLIIKDLKQRVLEGWEPDPEGL